MFSNDDAKILIIPDLRFGEDKAEKLQQECYDSLKKEFDTEVLIKAPIIEKDDKTIYSFRNKIKEVLSFMPYAEIMFVSALTGQRLPKLYEMIDMVIQNNTMRIQTGVLNEIITEATALKQPPSDKGKRLKILYGTQASTKPPTFVIFVNNKELFHFSYERYLVNQIRKEFGLTGTPVRMIVREKNEKDV